MLAPVHIHQGLKQVLLAMEDARDRNGHGIGGLHHDRAVLDIVSNHSLFEGCPKDDNPNFKESNVNDLVSATVASLYGRQGGGLYGY